MLYIYKYENKITGQIYIGQTNNIQKRKNGHHSDMQNPNSASYNLPLHAAMRKYGEDQFDFSIIEEIDDSFGREYLNEREIFFIDFYHSLINEQGYNISLGGGTAKKVKKTFEECCACSKIFTENEIRDIQQMLLNGYEFKEIREKYPKLTDSFISNINNGWNFKRDDLTYPLLKLHTKFTRDEKAAIINSLKNGVPYSQIAEKYNISISYLSQINNGTRWRQEEEQYPLYPKKCYDKTFIIECIKDILFTDLTYKEIGEKYNRSSAAVKAIAYGRNGHKDCLRYSLRKYREENQRIFNTILTQSCTDYPQLDVE